MTPPAWHFQRRGWTIRGLGAGLHVRGPNAGLLIGAPEGAVRRLSTEERSGLAALVLPSEHTPAIAGVLALLDAVESPTLEVVHAAPSPRIGALLDAWSQGWPDGVRLSADAALPHAPLGVADAELWFDGRGGVRLTWPDLTIAVATHARARATCADADLALLVLPHGAAVDLRACADQVDTLWVVDHAGQPWTASHEDTPA